jgi:hypothetical protein
VKALSFRQPWGWAITDLEDHQAKRLENRVWRNLKNGLTDKMMPLHTDFAIHVSKKNPFDYDYDGVAEGIGCDVKFLEETPAATLKSAIIGVAQIHMVLRCIDTMDIEEPTHAIPFPHYFLNPSDRDKFLYDLTLPWTTAQRHEQLKRWWYGPYAFVLKNVRKLREPVLEVSGALNFWQVPDDIVGKIREQLDVR